MCGDPEAGPDPGARPFHREVGPGIRPGTNRCVTGAQFWQLAEDIPPSAALDDLAARHGCTKKSGNTRPAKNSALTNQRSRTQEWQRHHCVPQVVHFDDEEFHFLRALATRENTDRLNR